MKTMAIFFSLLLLLLSSYRHVNGVIEISQRNSSTFDSVIAWLDSRMPVFKDPASKNVITSLKQNLIKAKLHSEIINGSGRLIVIPIKNEFETINHTTNPSFKNLIIECNGNAYLQGMIIEIIPQKQHFDEIPLNLISNAFVGYDNELNGIFSMLGLDNVFLSEREYKNGKLFSIKNLSIVKKNPPSSQIPMLQKAGPCYQIYLITSFYNTGKERPKTSEYLFSTYLEKFQLARMIDAKFPFKLSNDSEDKGGYQSSIKTIDTTVVELINVDTSQPH